MTLGPLLVVACGGTISSVRSVAGATPQLDAADLTAEFPQLLAIASLEALTFSTIASSQMTLDDVLALLRLIEGWVLAHADASGVVITHGTDTLEETAFALDLLWRHNIPVVVTGAMRNASSPGADGPANLLAAAVTASAPGARGMGVLVVMNDEIHLAGLVRKSHTSSLATFRSAIAGPVGFVSEGAARLVLGRRRRELLPALPADVAGYPVALITTGIGDDGRLLDHLQASGFRGAVIEGLGGGHLPPPAADAAARLARVMPVVLASRVFAGQMLHSTYSFEGSETDLLARGGIISAGMLDGPKARVLLSLLLAGGNGPAGIAETFARHSGTGV